MRKLRLVGLDDSGTRLVFRSEDDEDFTVEADERLVQAVRRTHGWQARRPDQTHGTGEGQADRQVETQTQDLRPREIQARVRAGESPEQVAASAGVEVERVARFARPVLQEREHVADAAQRVVVRTGALDGPLGEVVTDRLAHVVADPDVSWDAWRREDGRWSVSLTFRDDVQLRSARWSFDPTTNSVTVDDETARWLTEGTSSQAPAPTVTEPRTPRARRLLSVPDLQPEPKAAATYDEDEIAGELAALGLQPVAEPAPVTVVEVTETVVVEETIVAEQPDQQTAFDIPGAPAAPAAEVETPEAKPAKKARKNSKRASVPSWDDIVFGARKSTD